MPQNGNKPNGKEVKAKHGLKVLCLGGGGAKAQYQLPIIEKLVSEVDYDMVLGISAGAMNGVYVAQDDLEGMHRFWDRLEPLPFKLGVKGFARVSIKPWIGLYSLAPAAAYLYETTAIEKLKLKFGCGVTVRETNRFEFLMAENMRSDRQLVKSIIASAAIAGVVEPVKMKNDQGTWTLSDGGHRQNLPLPRVDVAHIDAVFCNPLITEGHEHVTNLPEAIAWSVETQLHIAKQLEIDALQAYAQEGARVRVYAPQSPLGGRLDMSKAIIARRIKVGEEIAVNPIQLDEAQAMLDMRQSYLDVRGAVF